jgi:hypothetical protein
VSGPPPEKVLGEYLEASTHQEYAKAYGFLSKADTDAVPLATYEKLFHPAPNAAIAHAIANRMMFRVISTEIKGANATVTMSMGSPEPATTMAALGTAATIVLTGTADELALERDLTSRLTKVPMISHEQSYHLVVEDGQWKVFLDLAKHLRPANLPPSPAPSPAGSP